MSVVDQRPRTQNRLADVIGAEWAKLTSSRLWLGSLGFGVFLAALSVVGMASDGGTLIDAGVPVEAVTAEIIRYWFMVVLASGIFGLLFVTREYGNGAIVRSVLLAGTRTRLFVAKLVISLVAGIGFALVVGVLIAVTAWVIVPLSGSPAQWSDEATKTTIGVMAVIVLAAPWGTAIGWIVRHQGAAMATFIVLTLVVDEGVFRLLPEVGRFTLQIAMGSIYLDDRADLLSVPVAVAVALAWITAGTALAGFLLRRRDVP